MGTYETVCSQMTQILIIESQSWPVLSIWKEEIKCGKCQ